jgi:hypothetical protein
MYTADARKGFLFTFDPFEHPDIFGTEKLAWCAAIGSFNPKSKKPGWVKDHKVSVSAAIRNGYDCYYITHPLNCELMTNSENSRKKDRCSLTYAELVALVDHYENGKPPTVAIRLR